MKYILTRGIICYKNELGIEFRVCNIDYFLYEDESFKYLFTPNYDVIDLLRSDNRFQGIPGLDLDLKEKVYERNNINPTFISERTPSSNREDLYNILEKVGLDYLNPIEYLIKSKEIYSGDSLYVIEFEENKRIIIDDLLTKNNSYSILKIAIENIARGNTIYLKDGTLLNSKDTFNMLLFLFKKNLETKKLNVNKTISRTKNGSNYKGRKPIEVDQLLFVEQLERVNKKQITAKQAAKNLGISIDKFYRVKKVLQK